MVKKMDDLISRQEAIDALNRLCPYPGEWAVNGLGLCKDAIANLPSIDAVQVVRCKDCKIRYTDRCGMFDVEAEWEWAEDNGFCQYGERKES